MLEHGDVRERTHDIVARQLQIVNRVIPNRELLNDCVRFLIFFLPKFCHDLLRLSVKVNFDRFGFLVSAPPNK